MCEGINNDSYIDLTKLSLLQAQVLGGGGDVRDSINQLSLIYNCQPIKLRRSEDLLLRQINSFIIIYYYQVKLQLLETKPLPMFVLKLNK